MKEAAKKAMERAYLQRFRVNFADFPEGEVVLSEHPDFLVKTRSRWIGIELTELSRSGTGRGLGFSNASTGGNGG